MHVPQLQLSPIWQNLVAVTERPNISKEILLSSLIQGVVGTRLEQTHREIPHSVSVIRGKGNVMQSLGARSSHLRRAVTKCTRRCRAQNSRKVPRFMKGKGKQRLCLKTGVCPQVKKPS